MSVWVTLCLLPFFVLANSITNDKFTRKLSADFNCSDAESGILVLGIKAEGEHDTLYHIWSSAGSFAIMTIRLKVNTTIEHNCTEWINKFSHKALSFSQPPIYRFAMVMTKVIEFNDVNGKGNIADAANITLTNFEDLRWHCSDVIVNDNQISAEFRLLDNTFGNNSLRFKLSAFGFTERVEQLPRLIHTANLTMVDFTIDHSRLKYGTESRFGLLFYVLNDNATDWFCESSIPQIDDEYTPGVFKIIQVLLESGQGGFLQWKPTVYTSPDHVHQSSTVVKENTLFLDADDKTLLNNSSARVISLIDVAKMQAMNVTFGMTGDNYFISTNYSSWTFSVGYGKPPMDEVSSMVIVIIAVGLGIPVVLLIAGGIYLIVVRLRAKKDDLLLSN